MGVREPSAARAQPRAASSADAPSAEESAWRWLGREGAAVALVFALAFALRLALLFAGDDAPWPHSLRYEGDAPTWARWAAALGRGQPFEFDLPVRAPGVAFALHWLGAAQAPYTSVKLLWCALSAASCAGLWALLAHRASRAAAWIGALALALSNADLQLATSLNGEAPYAALIVALLALELRPRSRRALAHGLACGALHGVALLVRPEHLLLVALLAVLDSFELRRVDWRRWAASALALLAVCAPWAWRSHQALVRFNREGARIDFARAQPPWSEEARAELERLPAFAREGNFAFLSHLARQRGRPQVQASDLREYFEREWAGYVPEPLPEWTLVSSKGALDFALANHPAADGGFSRAALRDGRDDEPEFAFGRPSHLRLYLHGWSIGWSWIAKDPLAWARACGAKLARFWAGASSGLGADNWPHGPASVRGAVDLSRGRDLARWWSLAVLAVVLVGAWSARATAFGRALIATVLYKLVVTLVFYGYARQAASIGPVFAALTALALERLATGVLAGRSRAAGLALRWSAVAVFSVLALASLRPTPLAPVASPAGLRLDPSLGPGAFEFPLEFELRALEQN